MANDNEKRNFYLVKRISDIIKYEKFPFIVLFVLMVCVHITHKLDVGDDFWFQQVTKDYSFINYLNLRYFAWTGRMTSEMIFYFIFRDGGFIWKVINPLFITLMAYCISRIVLGKKNDQKNYIINCYICLGWLFFSKAVILDSVMWATGSVVYLWGMVFALFAIIPYRDALKGEYSEKFSILYIILAILASMSEEQIALVVLTFAIVININLYLRDKKINKYLLIENIFIIIGTLILFLAPGNYVRKLEETISWLPNYRLYSKWEIGFYGVQWLLNTLLNNCKVIFLLILIVLTIRLYYKERESKNKFSIIIPAIGCLLIGSSIIFTFDTNLPDKIIKYIKIPDFYRNIGQNLNVYLFNFSIPSTFALKKLSVIKFIIWPIIIGTVPYLISYLYDFKSDGKYIALSYIGGICSAAVMFVSPTMYASGVRTFFVLVVMFLFVFICLLKKCSYQLIRKSLIIFAFFGALKFVYIFLH